MKHRTQTCCWIIALTGWCTGCSGLFGPKATAVGPPRVMVEHENDVTSMSPEERDRQFRAHFNEGLELAGRGQYGLALAAYEQALKLRPESTEALFNLAACHDAVGDPMRAIAIYRELLKIAPDDPDCYANLGTSFIKMYHREMSPAWRRMAWEAWEQSLRLRPDQPSVRAYLAHSKESE